MPCHNLTLQESELKNNIISMKLARESFHMHCHEWQKLKLLLSKHQYAQLNLCI
jgi:hypothetical protein